jgi:hypothetical protein
LTFRSSSEEQKSFIEINIQSFKFDTKTIWWSDFSKNNRIRKQNRYTIHSIFFEHKTSWFKRHVKISIFKRCRKNAEEHHRKRNFVNDQEMQTSKYFKIEWHIKQNFEIFDKQIYVDVVAFVSRLRTIKISFSLFLKNTHYCFKKSL